MTHIADRIEEYSIPHAPCAPQAEEHLARMIAGDHRDLLSEWLNAFIKSRKLMSNQSLSLLLRFVKFRAEYWNEVSTIITNQDYPPDEGDRFFRNSYNAEHTFSLDTLTDARISDLWQTEELTKRWLLLTTLRKQKPDQARDLLQSTWKTEPLKARKTLLPVLETNLSISDEPFIEAALDDRAGHVRSAAAHLLPRISGSRYLKRMVERIEPLLHYRPATTSNPVPRFRVSLPEAFTPGMKRDGVFESVIYYGMDAPTFWLCDMIERVPLPTWTQLWNATARDLVQAALNSGKRKKALLRGWQAAYKLLPSPDWAEAFLALTSSLSDNQGRAWFAEMLPEKQEQLVTRTLASHRDSLHTPDMPLKALTRISIPWSPPFSRTILQRLHLYASPDAPEDPAILESIPMIARALAPETSPEAGQLLSSLPPTPTYYSAALANLVATVQFRREMLEALAL